ncbi:MAG: adenosylcobinamide-GDP ribazoletransferase [Chloroflexi bacterium]|nr:adenosylcobinamide-GDP ribazoletransferase [Chloroflexota bacterium]
MKGFWAALEFLTVLPSPEKGEFKVEDLGRSLVFFPLVGLLLGLALWGLDTGLSMVLPSLPVNVLLVGALVIITGGMHIDGFIDSCDGAAARRTVQQRLDIMADSRVGAFGVAGGCLLLLLKVSALASLPGTVRVIGLVLMPVLGRWAMVLAVHAYPYARGPSGKGYAFKAGATMARMLLALTTALVIAFVAARGSWHGPALLAAASLGAVGCAWYLKTRLGGLTGDSYGALNEVAEVLAVLLLPTMWRA